MKPFRQCQRWDSGQAQHQKRRQTVHVYNRPASTLFQRRRFLREDLTVNNTAQPLAWTDCSAALFEWCVRRQALDATLQGSCFADRKALCSTFWKQWLWNFHTWQKFWFHSNGNWWGGNILFWPFRLSIIRFLQCIGKIRVAKDFFDSARRNLSILVVCWTCPAVNYGARWEEKSWFCYCPYNALFCVSFTDAICFAYNACLFVWHSTTYSIDDDDDDAAIAPSGSPLWV